MIDLAPQEDAAMVCEQLSYLILIDEWALLECRSFAMEAFTEAGCTEEEMRDCFTGDTN